MERKWKKKNTFYIGPRHAFTVGPQDYADYARKETQDKSLEELCFGMDQIIDIKGSAVAEEKRKEENRAKERAKQDQESFVKLLSSSKVWVPAFVSFLLGMLSTIITSKITDKNDNTDSEVHQKEELHFHEKEMPKKIIFHRCKVAERNLVSQVRNELTK